MGDTRTVIRDVDVAHNRDLLTDPPRACLAFVADGRPDIVPVSYVGDEHRGRVAIRGDSPTPNVGDEVVVLVDAGRSWFELRAVLLRGHLVAVVASAQDTAAFEFAVDRTVAWDYGSLRLDGDSPRHPPRRTSPRSAPPDDLRRIVASSRVARIATVTASGRVAVTPLYFTMRNDLHIWLGTADWTLAARNAERSTDVAVLIGAEMAASAPTVRMSGRAVVRRSRPTVGAYQLGAALRHVLTPAAMVDAFAHRELKSLRRRYYAQSVDRGRPCVIDVSADRIDIVPAVGH